jgi:hypothetical protein
MRGTLIVYAHPETLRLMAEHQKRFYGHRESFRDRFYAAWLVFTGRADALSWEAWPESDPPSVPNGERGGAA